MKNKIGFYVSIIVVIFLFGILFYPTLYRYDKLDQRYPVKINRITGKTEVLTDKGWNLVENITEDKMASLRTELMNKLDADRKGLKDEISEQVTTTIKDDILSKVKDDLNKTNTEITQYKKFELDPTNYFTIGSTMEDVKKIMGVPTSSGETYLISGKYMQWTYGSSTVIFSNNKVKEYTNLGENLRVR